MSSSFEDRYVLGFDFGTESCRALCVNVKDGAILGDSALEYPSKVIEKRLPGSDAPLAEGWFLQDPDDYLFVLGELTRTVLQQSDVPASRVMALGIDFTNCTMLPVDDRGRALCQNSAYRSNPHSWVKLWKHHAAEPYARMILEKARDGKASWLEYYGNAVSAEWLFPKILQIFFEAPGIYAQTDLFMEATDWIVYRLTGRPVRSSATLGVNAFWQEPGGYPPADFWKTLDPGLRDLVVTRLRGDVLPVGSAAGSLTPEAAALLDLPENVVVAIGHGDSEVAACGLGVVEPETMVCVMGTSTCYQYMSRLCRPFEGIGSVVRDGMIPGYYAYEAGQAATGDIFAWFVKNALPRSCFEEARSRNIGLYGLMNEKASRLRVGENGLVALDWLNGNRSPLMNYDLTGMILGLTLRTAPEDIYRALLESTAFGAKKIMDAFIDHGLPVRNLVATGGLALKNPFLVQLYCDVLGKPIHVPKVVNASALGAAVCAAVAAGAERGGYVDFPEAVGHMVPKTGIDYRPNMENRQAYAELYDIYSSLCFSMGGQGESAMKRLRRIAANS